ncbi:ArnT family glycosyltransferase [Roseospira visakhapatnamensis]|uniref:Glycosyltransferase RgtA/B/C/D-like domain-containing protein n=1 Tax=Roseospira visakhapatnamensis TaxID=390880 RepID=A0A7W6RDA5_9PROT|nr:glycosyltransferase family 39 protein [Roseospira visakhapatnamensis]MBB4265813.1 hypothetical protein [Roseospira visakhapatnamensis]
MAVAPLSRPWSDLKDPARATLILIGGTALVRVLLAVLMDFGNGESYYLAGTREPHLSYFDQPPLALWLGWAMLALTGSDDPAVIRLPFILIFAATTWVLFSLTRRLISPWAGFFAALFLNISAVFTVSVGGWFQPDGPLMLFWLLTAWALARVMLEPDQRTRAWPWWLVIGLLLGLTLLAKYHAVFLVAGAGLFALTRPDQRHWVRHPAPYVAGLLALAVAAPVLIWNAQNDWVSFAFQSGRSVESAGLRPDWLLRSIVGQMTWLLPWVWLPMIWVFAAALLRGPTDANRTDWFLACLAVGPIAFFTVIALWAPLGFHFHWQAPGYLMLFPLLGRMAERGLARRPRLTGVWLSGSVTVTALVLAVLASHIGTNWIAHVVPLDKDPTLEALEWRALREDLAETGLLDRPETFAAAVHWVEGGKVDSAVGGALPVVVLSNDPRNLAFTLDLRAAEGWDMLLMGSGRRLGDDPRARFTQSLDRLEPIGTYTLTRGGDVVIEDIQAWLGRGFTLRRAVAFDGTDAVSYFGDGWGPVDAGAGARAVAADTATLRVDLDPRVPYGPLRVQARSADGQQTLTVAWNGTAVGRLVLPEDGSVVTLDTRVPGARRVDRRQGTITITPERPGAWVHDLRLEPDPLP